MLGDSVTARYDEALRPFLRRQKNRALFSGGSHCVAR